MRDRIGKIEEETGHIAQMVNELMDLSRIESGAAVLHLDALGAFRRSRCWLAPAASADLVTRQEAVVAAVLGTGADLHRHYRPGLWVPHLTLAPRLHTADLPTVARVVYDVLPLTVPVTRAALIETATGDQHPLDHLV